MLRSYFKIAWRNIAHNKGYAIINIPGLALGMSCFIILAAYVHFEKSYDRIHADARKIYRVESQFFKGEHLTDDWPTSTNGYATAIKKDFPEIKSVTRINWNNAERVVRYNNIKFREKHVCFADTNFFSFFSYPLLKGTAASVLKESNSIVISEAAAKKYFGYSDPLGKILELSSQSDLYRCMVKGVFKDIPANSTMQFDMLVSWTTSPEWMRDFWYIHESYTFVKLQPGTNPAFVESKFPALAEKYKTADALKDLKWGIDLVPLTDIHLNKAKQYEVEPKGNRQAVHFLSVLAFIIFIIGCINYVNLSTAKTVERAREMGVRKISGAQPVQIIGQFLLESFLINAIAFLLAIAFVVVAKYLLVQFISDQSFGLLMDGGLFIKAGILFFSGVLLAGVYPAVIVLAMKPIAVLKGKYSFSKQGLLMRKGLVMFQFIISLVLIAGTIAVYRQVIFMNEQPVGAAIDQTIVMKAPVNTKDYTLKIGQFKTSLLSLPGIEAVTGSGSVPGKEVGKFLANKKYGDASSEERPYEMLKVDFDFVSTYQLQVLAGRTFDKNRPSDSTGLLLNESAVKQFGFVSNEKAVGEKIWLEVNRGKPNEVIGVIKDYHQQSLQQKYTPLILFMDPDYSWIPSDLYSVRVKANNIDKTIAAVQKLWVSSFPESSFDFFFLDEYYNRQYQQEKNFGRVFFLFSSLAIFIACMGLFALTAFSTARRTKEIGVRKVLGASVQKIVSMLSADAVKLVFISSVIALPLSYIFIVQWLNSYAFRVPLSWWQFALPIIALLLITILTISFLTIKAAVANPVQSLRTE